MALVWLLPPRSRSLWVLCASLAVPHSARGLARLLPLAALSPVAQKLAFLSLLGLELWAIPVRSVLRAAWLL